VSRTDSPLRGRMVFVVGARRSGTNWLQRALAAHPSVVGVPSETYLFSEGLDPLRKRFHHGALSSSHTGAMHVDRDVLLDGLRAFCDAVFLDLLHGIDPGAERLVERTPDHVRHLDLIGDVYPDAWVLHIIRDGRDVARSLLSHDWGPSQARDAAVEWRSAIESARAAAPKLEHYVEVRYEDLLSDPSAAMQRLFDRIALPASAEDVRGVVAEAGARYNVDPGAPQIASGKWRTGLTGEALEAVQDAAGDMLASLGYDEPLAAEPSEPPEQPPAPKRPPVRHRLRRSSRSAAEAIRPSDAQRVVDRFLEAAATDPERVRELLAPDVRVRLVASDARSERRGPDAVDGLIDVLRSDEAIRGRQAAGYVHPSVPAVTFVGEFDAGGRRHPRVVVLTLGPRGVTRLAYYRFPAS
jgi:hypothetical protein